MHRPNGQPANLIEGKVPSRRRFLWNVAAVTGGVVGARAVRAEETAPPADADWSKMLGPGVVDPPYGQPSEFVKDVILRNVPWQTATP